MKIILSRKGFDNSSGGCASPILPDGTLLSMPIPDDDSIDEYKDLYYNNISYDEILKSLVPKLYNKKSYNKCHLDPDIKPNIRKNRIDNWVPAFGQMGTAQTKLMNAGVDIGDVFLFFGWFRGTTLTENGYEYNNGKELDFYSKSNLHVIYGYMQIGKIITDPKEIAKYNWHVHASKSHINGRNNALYIASDKLTSLDSSLPGCSTLDYRQDRVLTQFGESRSIWKPYEFLMPDHIYPHRKNSNTKGNLQYKSQWQEIVVNESSELIKWAKSIIHD